MKHCEKGTQIQTRSEGAVCDDDISIIAAEDEGASFEIDR